MCCLTPKNGWRYQTRRTDRYKYCLWCRDNCGIKCGLISTRTTFTIDGSGGTPSSSCRDDWTVTRARATADRSRTSMRIRPFVSYLVRSSPLRSVSGAGWRTTKTRSTGDRLPGAVGRAAYVERRVAEAYEEGPATIGWCFDRSVIIK